MGIYDTHLHLNDESFLDKEEEYIKEANEKGVTLFNVIAWDLKSSKKAIELAHRFENVFAVVGIHPSDVVNASAAHLEEIEKLLSDEKVVAYGEIGLDYHWWKEKHQQELQKQWLVEQIEIANRAKLPIVFHVRDAIDDIYEILSKVRVDCGGVIHCFSGNTHQAQKFVDLGFFIGIDGPLTYRKNEELKLVVQDLPIEKILVETDAPYLSPSPYRGKPNHSKYLPFIVEEIAKIKGESNEKIISITTDNALKLFHVKR